MSFEQRVAQLLVEVTEQVLWREIQPWLRDRGHRIQLHCRVGSGRATHHRQQGARHSITYGRKMVASKRCPLQAELWTTAREIRARGYFRGQWGLAELLAHTCCHEFAHLVQSLNGWYGRGSIHNAGFYQILDRIHRSGSAQRVLEALLRAAQDAQLELGFLPPGAAARDTAPVPAPVRGQRVRFQYRGKLVSGVVTRIHRQTVRVENHGIAGVGYFRVPPAQLQLD
ncbi:hypothetical protein [Aestuariirhabdus litorea]|uniref:Uncharacterized protein n=1 Tax=Aestuariirhabdus litorea TaxID=2528527 RepID=A0A3P3VPL9_9GAMM|nr:hypothetical protein [Aestuariirhabdus litorea]RRJ82763.1 hypothetical protein D0544_12980 [Aestuariirhabdus litorea]RWW92924.1 hypothetical protein DZC74_12955 [Endozoicomonadaceae bacterium GTF-13]